MYLDMPGYSTDLLLMTRGRHILEYRFETADEAARAQNAQAEKERREAEEQKRLEEEKKQQQNDDL